MTCWPLLGQDIRDLPLHIRRELLEELALDWEPSLNLSPVTADRETAEQWFTDLPGRHRGSGRQRCRQAYRADVVFAAVLGSRLRPTVLVLGLPMGGKLRFVGQTVNLKPEVSLLAGQLLQPGDPNHPWPAEINYRILNRFTENGDAVRLMRVEPIVADVSADTAFANGPFRHPLRFLRLRPEVDPPTISPA